MENTINSVDQLSDSLAKAQGEIVAPKKTQKVDFTNNKGQRVKYNYADLADVIESCRLPLSKNGLSVTHQLQYSDFGFGMITVLLHSSGQKISTWYPLPDPAKETIRAQEFGSALTYARRYSLSCLVGIASEEDDDGNGAADTEPPKGLKPSGNSPVKPKELTLTSAGAEGSGDYFDQIPGVEEPEMTYLEQLYHEVEFMQLTPEQVKKMIKIVCGREKKSVELNDFELQGVLKLIRLGNK